PLTIRGPLERHFPAYTGQTYAEDAEKIDALCLFFEERLSVQLRESGISADKLEAVLGKAGLVQGNKLMSLFRRVEALGKLLDTEDGKNLLAGTKRAANILAAEEKKGTAIAASVDPAKFRDDAEKALFAALNQAESKAAQAI